MNTRHSTFLIEDRGDMLVENMVGVLIVGASLVAGLWGMTGINNSSNTNAANHQISVEAKNQVEHLAASKTYPAPGTTTTSKVGTRTATIWSTQSDPAANAVKTDVHLSVPLEGYTTADCPAKNTSINCVTLTSSSTKTLAADVIQLDAAPNQSTDTYTVKIPAGTSIVYYSIYNTTNRALSSFFVNSYQGATKFKVETELTRKGWTYGVIKISPTDNITTIGFRDTNTTHKLTEQNVVVLAQRK